MSDAGEGFPAEGGAQGTETGEPADEGESKQLRMGSEKVPPRGHLFTPAIASPQPGKAVVSTKRSPATR